MDAGELEGLLLDAYEPQLSTEQRQAILAAVVQRQNVFITGGAGSGKSLTARVIEERLRRGCVQVAVVAPTWQAAHSTQISSAVTLHRALGWRARAGWASRAHEPAPLAVEALRLCGAVIVDEISMVSAAALARLTGALSPGCQVILLGDPAQLPPVATPDSTVLESARAEGSRAWAALQLRKFVLPRAWRQDEDREFAAFLARARAGALRDGDAATLRAMCSAYSPEKHARWPHIFGTCAAVAEHNAATLQQLVRDGAPGQTVRPVTEGDPAAVQELLSEMGLGDECALVEGALYYLRANVAPQSGWYTNQVVTLDSWDLRTGTVCLTRRSDSARLVLPRWRWHDTDPRTSVCKAEVWQFPLRPAYSATVHAVQGSTLDCGVVCPADFHAPASMYVALSRFRSLSGCVVRGTPELVLAALRLG